MRTNPIKIGILGTSSIAVEAIIEPAMKNDAVTIVAVASRSIIRAKQFAQKYDIQVACENYTSLITREDIDIVYVGLPASEHAKWSILALEAGKHVLCEKPFAMSKSEALNMVEVAARCGKYLMEAFHYRFHPLFSRAQQLLTEIGQVIHVDAAFSFPVLRIQHKNLYNPKLCRGSLMDLGTYPIHLVRTMLAEEPNVKGAKGDFMKNGTERTMELELEFPSGITANIKSSFWSMPKVYAEFKGTNGVLRINNFIVPSLYNKIAVKTPELDLNLKIKAPTTYECQLNHVVKVLRGEATPLTGGEDAIANMQVLDDAYKVAKGDA
jgi:predicted dehydrogenase